MAREPFLLLMIAALAGASLWLARSPADSTGVAIDLTEAGITSGRAATTGAAATTGELASQDTATPKTATTDPSRQLQLPDGSFVDTLNGATNPKPLAEFWGTQIPWSPIVGVEQNDQGVAWYRHENGSYSTTETHWDSAGKRYVTLTRVAHQGPAAPAIAPRR